MNITEDERQKRWRLVLGKDAEAESVANSHGLDATLEGEDLGMDAVLAALYDGERSAGLGASSPNVQRWLGDIRRYFPASVVRIMQKDALDRLHLESMLLEPELLSSVEPDVHLVSTLLSLKSVIPQKTKATARAVVARVVKEIEKRLRSATISAIRGALSRSTRSRRPRAGEIDFDRTIAKNLRHYVPDRKTLVVEKLVGRGRRSSALRDIVLCVDQSGSMATSVVYASVFGAVLASLRAVKTHMVVFDTAVVDLSEHLRDPVDLLFGAQLGGGTDIDRALTYCTSIIRRPLRTTLFLISDLYEGGDRDGMIRRAAALVARGVSVIALLALSDDGAPAFDKKNAADLAALGVPAFAATPDVFPSLVAAAIQKKDLGLWAAREGIVVQR